MGYGVAEWYNGSDDNPESGSSIRPRDVVAVVLDVSWRRSWCCS